MGTTDYSSAPTIGYSAAKDICYFGYKLHTICGLGEAMHLYDMTPANVQDVNYMKGVKFEFHNCGIFGDCVYISTELKQHLFSSVGIKL